MSLLAQLLPKKETKEYFLTLCITDHAVRAAIASIVNASITVLGTGDSRITPEKPLLAACDEAITHAEKPLPSGTMVKTVVFALPQHYLQDEHVKPDHLETIKTISRELDLSPRGFIEYPSAISFYLEKEEGSPPTLLLIALEGSHITFSLLRLGKVQQQVQVPASETFTSDFSSALSQLTAEILPSRILLFDSGLSLDHIRDELLKFPWHKHAQFIHTPKVEIFPQTHLLAALIEAGASSFLRNLPHEPSVNAPAPGTSRTSEPALPHPKHTAVAAATAAAAAAAPIPVVHSTEEEVAPSLETDHTVTHNIQQFAHKVLQNAEETFGFVKETSDEEEPHSSAHHPSTDHKIHHPTHEELRSAHHAEHHTSHHTEHAPDPEEEEAAPAPRSGWRSKLPTVPMPIGMKLPSFALKLPNIRTGNRLLWALIPLVLFIIGAGWLVWFVPQATISLGVYPLSTSQIIDVTFATTTDQTTSGQTLLVREISQEVSGTKSAPATGTGKVGDKAKGSVTLYNKTSSSKTFPKGTILTNGDLRFTLDEDATVASSSDTGEGLTFGKTNVNVSAAAIGPESNLAGNSVFLIKDFPESSYTAKNTQSFTGGASRDVASVSKSDQTQIEEALMQELLGQAKSQLSQALTDGEKLIDGTIQTEISTKKFSAEVGSEAKEVTLTLSIKARGRSYREEEMQQLAKATFATLPSGFSQTPRTMNVAVDKITNEKDGTSKASVRVTAYFLPEIDIPGIKKNLVGKTFAQAQTYGATIPSLAGLKITQDRTLPLFTNRLPLRSDAITIQTVVY